MNKKVVLSLVAIALLLPLLAAIFLMPNKAITPGSPSQVSENGGPSKREGATAQQADEASKAATDVATDKVSIEGFTFMPQTIRVTVGDTVTWTNKDAVVHTVTAVNASPDAPNSGDIAQNETYSFTFKKAGTYDYYCKPHPEMRATVVVTE